MRTGRQSALSTSSSISCPPNPLATLPLDVASEWFTPALAGGVFHAHRRLRQLPTTR